MGRFLSVGRLADNTGVTSRSALRIGANAGGLPELMIPNAEFKVVLERVLGLNPEF